MTKQSSVPEGVAGIFQKNSIVLRDLMRQIGKHRDLNVTETALTPGCVDPARKEQTIKYNRTTK